MTPRASVDSMACASFVGWIQSIDAGLVRPSPPSIAACRCSMLYGVLTVPSGHSKHKVCPNLATTPRCAGPVRSCLKQTAGLFLPGAVTSLVRNTMWHFVHSGSLAAFGASHRGSALLCSGQHAQATAGTFCCPSGLSTPRRLLCPFVSFVALGPCSALAPDEHGGPGLEMRHGGRAGELTYRRSWRDESIPR